MDFEQAYEYASGEIRPEELKTNTTEITGLSSPLTASTASTRRNSNASLSQGAKEKKLMRFGKF